MVEETEIFSFKFVSMHSSCVLVILFAIIQLKIVLYIKTDEWFATCRIFYQI